MHVRPWCATAARHVLVLCPMPACDSSVAGDPPLIMIALLQLAFRQTVHKYGVDLCWTPMILPKSSTATASLETAVHQPSSYPQPPPPRSTDLGEARLEAKLWQSDLTISTHGAQPPTILQFGANSALELSRAVALAAPFVSGIDLNCGCPQSWACAETLGAALMDQRHLIRDMVDQTRRRLRDDGWAVSMREHDLDSPRGRSVSVKIRVHDDLRKTIDFLDTVIGHAQNRLVDWVTIHPLTRHTPSTVPIRTDALELLTAEYAGTLPVLLSGDVFALSSLPFQAPSDLLTLSVKPDPGSAIDLDARSLPVILRPNNCRLAGFMSARGLLANPPLFAGYVACPWEALEAFMCNVARCPLPFKLVIHHVTQMCGPGMGSDKSALLPKEWAKLSGLTNMMDLIDFLDDKIEEQTGRTGGLRRDQ